MLDEADRMLDMGFIHDVRKILARAAARPPERCCSRRPCPRTSSTWPSSILRDPVRVEVTPPATTVERIDAVGPSRREEGQAQRCWCEVLRDPALERVLVFTRTKHGADKVVQAPAPARRESADAIHGNKSQGARERALDGFRRAGARVLVATDIAARGIDVRDITHVINFDLPNVPESYVHRIGRTARAGRDGVAISFCDDSEREYLRAIEKEIGREVPIVSESTFPSVEPPRTDRGKTRPKFAPRKRTRRKARRRGPVAKSA